MYLTAPFGLRLAHRRTLAQWTTIDFAAAAVAVAVGAIIGRTAVASTQSVVVGIVALLTILLAHSVITYARYQPWFLRLTDHRVRILVDRERLRRRQLLICGITTNDLFSETPQPRNPRPPAAPLRATRTKGRSHRRHRRTRPAPRGRTHPRLDQATQVRTDPDDRPLTRAHARRPRQMSALSSADPVNSPLCATAVSRR